MGGTSDNQDMPPIAHLEHNEKQYAFAHTHTYD